MRAVLTGRVLQRGDMLMISAELVDVQANKQIWGQQYARKLVDVFAVQEEIAREVSENLRLRLTRVERQQLAKRPTENLKAFQYYTQSRAFAQRRTRQDLLTAINYCEKAIEEDRGYALAYAGLADATSALGLLGHISPAAGRLKTEELARKAVALDDNLAEAHVALAVVDIMFTPANFSRGDRELRRAIELSPSSALAHFYSGVSLTRQGRFDEGLAALLKARELDPLSAVIARTVAFPDYLKRDYGRSLAQRSVDDLGAMISTWEIGLYVQLRLFDETLAQLAKAKQERPSDPILIYSTGMIYAAQGKPSEAHQIIEELRALPGPDLSQALWIAKIYATLKQREETFAWLERGLAAETLGLFFKDDPVWDPIRRDPRFEDLLRRTVTTS